MKPNLTKHLFRRKHARYQIVFKSAITTLTAGTVQSFHVFGEKGGLLWFTIVNTIQICIFEQDLRFLDLLPN